MTISGVLASTDHVIHIPETTAADTVRAWIVLALLVGLVIAYVVLHFRLGRIRVRKLQAPLALAGAVILLIGGLWNESLSSLLSSFFKGLTNGGLFALIAVGYTMVYGVVKIINFAHGEIFMFAGFFMFAFMSETAAWPAVASALFILCILLGSTWVLGGKRKPALKAGISAGSAIPLAIGCYFLFTSFTLPFFLALILTIILTAGLGVTCDLVAYKPIRTAPRLSALLTAIGLSIAFQNLALLIWGGDAFRFPLEEIPAILKLKTLPEGGAAGVSFWQLLVEYKRLRVMGTEVPLLDLITIIVTFVSMAALWYIVARTKVGKAMRAAALDKVTAALMGVSVNRTVAVTFAIGSAFAAVGAAFYCLVNPSALDNLVGYQVGIVAFAAAVLGGIGSIPGACFGGFLIGFAMTLAPKLNLAMFFAALGFSREFIASLPELTLVSWEFGFAYMIMILVIIFRPSGILGKEEAAARA